MQQTDKHEKKLKMIEEEYNSIVSKTDAEVEELKKQERMLEEHLDNLYETTCVIRRKMEDIQAVNYENKSIEDLKEVDLILEILQGDYIKAKRDAENELDNIEEQQKKHKKKIDEATEIYHQEIQLLRTGEQT